MFGFLTVLLPIFTMLHIYSSFLEANVVTREDRMNYLADPKGASISKHLEDVLLPILPHSTCQKQFHTLNVDGDSTQRNQIVHLTRNFSVVKGLARLHATFYLARSALYAPLGDFVETGVYKGGTAGIMMHVLLTYDPNCYRKLYTFDSFEGLPNVDLLKDTPKTDIFDSIHSGFSGAFRFDKQSFLQNMVAMNAVNDRLIVVKGWFRNTIPVSPIQKISFLRLDGDLFESTWDVLTGLYKKVVIGGYVYVDDYYTFPGCRLAVDTFRAYHKIVEPIRQVRESPGRFHKNATKLEAVYWRVRWACSCE